ncbi:MAG TPA: Nif3-like dinuclear metal center hexameric protein [Halococcus sp.]|nr:Nif3-like dinuclear metal center hexameric protein [Halococcus sp.]
MDLDEFCERYDDRLRTDAYGDLDASANGLQVGSDKSEIEHAAFAVDAAVETAERAAEADADVLCVHHGLFWGEFERATGRIHDRLAPFFANDIALYTSHLPLDGHPDLGNAARICERLGLENREAFGTLGSEHIGQCGRAEEPVAVAGLRERLESELGHGGERTDYETPEVRVFDFGPDEIETVAVVTGGGADWLSEATAADVDAFITGEGKQKLYHEAKESNINVFLGGHYATETFGVRSLQDLAEEWGLETTFIDCPTGL